MRSTHHSGHGVSLVARIGVGDVYSHQHSALVEDPGKRHRRILVDGVDGVGAMVRC
jgi:hypothetical protein